MRTHSCGELSKKEVGNEVKICGWVQNRRDHGGLIFVDLRDKWGLTQVVFDPENDKKSHKLAEKVRSEWCLKVSGKVRERGEGLTNPKLKTGEIEIEVMGLEVLNESKTPPFEIEDETKAGEEVRLKNRFLDMRRPRVQKMLKRRAEVTGFLREWMTENGFTEIATPILANSSPEGARDFLVPSRLQPGKFFALPQAPQQFKQLLMVGGLDKYFQIAPCFRDEDPRADRHTGDFYQLDLEMSFVSQEEVLEVVEGVISEMAEKFGEEKKSGWDFQKKEWIKNKAGKKWGGAKDGWPRMSWRDAISHFGSDKPDLRFDLCIENVGEELAGTGFGVFANCLKGGKVVHALNVPDGAKMTRKEIDALTELAKEQHAKGLAWLKVGEESGPVAKNVEGDLLKKVVKKMKAKEGDLIFFGADEWEIVCQSLGAVRKEVGQKILGLADPEKFAWAWILDMPFFEMNEEGKFDFGHNPFSMPIGGMKALESEEPLEIKSNQFDFVCNGFECGSGAIRNHDPKILQKAFEMVGHKSEDVKKEFGHMMEAFEFGAPPHGGCAPGIDRLMMLLLGEENVREVIAFPKSSSGRDEMMGSPSEVDGKILGELGLKVG